MTKRIEGVEIFAAGDWNGRTFTTSDLDSMVSSFNALSLAGRVPLKLTHDGPDARDDPESRLALGWVHKLWRQDDRLLADIEATDKAAELIRAGALRFVSVELLKNVRADTRVLPWVLDAVALLGADQPAVGVLKSLQDSLFAASVSRLQFDTRQTFSRGGNSKMDEMKKLKNDWAKDILDTAVKEGRILPRDSHAFAKRYGDAGTPEDARQWIADSPRPTASQQTGRINGRSGNATDSGLDTGKDASQRLVDAAGELMETREAEGRPITFDRAVSMVLQSNSSLSESYKRFTLGTTER